MSTIALPTASPRLAPRSSVPSTATPGAGLGSAPSSSATAMASWSAWRRFAIVAAVVLMVVVTAVGSFARAASSSPVEQVSGHVMVQPGGSLWEVAVTTAPAGVSPQEQLDAIRQLNGVHELPGGTWSVVLLPAH